MNNYIKFPGVFKPGLTDVQYITEAQYVKGSYIVLESMAERDALSDSILVQGLLVYVAEVETEYRYKDGKWEENVPAFDDAPVDGKLYARKDGQWAVIDLSGYATNEELALAISSIVFPELPTKVSQLENDAGYLTEHQSLEGYAKVTDIPDVSGFVTMQEVEGKNYLTSEDIVDKADKTHTHNISEIEGYTPTDLTGYATENYVKNAIAEAELNDKDVDLTGYATKDELAPLATKSELAEVEGKIPSVEGLASEQFVSDKISEIAIPVVPTKVSEFENDAGYITNKDIPEAEIYKVDFNAPDYASAVEAYNKGKVLVLINAAPDVNSYAVMNYVTDKYITFTKFLTSRSEAYGSFNTYYLSPSNTWELSKEVVLNKVEANVSGEAVGNLSSIRIGKEIYNIPTTEGLATETFVQEAVSAKADKIPFSVDKFVGNALGGFSKNDSLKGMSVVEILTKLLQLSDTKEEEPDTPDVPSEPDSVVAQIIANKHPMYSVSVDGVLEAHEFEIITLDATSGEAAPTKSGFYQIVDNGVVVESGYQDLQVANDEMYYVVALPKIVDYNTMVRLEAFDPDENKWFECEKLPLTSDPNTVSALCDEAGIDTTIIDTNLYTIWAMEDICTGSQLRYIIEE